MTTSKIKIVDPSKYSILCIDASKDGLGIFFTQEGHVIYYEFKNLKEHEKNYVVHAMELAATIHSLKICDIIWWEIIFCC